jgi:hypothetical protein
MFTGVSPIHHTKLSSWTRQTRCILSFVCFHCVLIWPNSPTRVVRYLVGGVCVMSQMTNAAQSALRRMMESYSKVTRFCIICNYVTRYILVASLVFMLSMNRAFVREVGEGVCYDGCLTLFCFLWFYFPFSIIDPITSRCAKFRFKPLPSASIAQRLSDIARVESIELEEQVNSSNTTTTNNNNKNNAGSFSFADVLYPS